MGNQEMLKQLAARAKKRLLDMSAIKTKEDSVEENKNFALFEPYLYKEITKGDSQCN